MRWPEHLQMNTPPPAILLHQVLGGYAPVVQGTVSLPPAPNIAAAFRAGRAALPAAAIGTDFRVRVHPWNFTAMAITHLSAREVVDLIDAAGAARWLDLSECDLSGIDLGPTALQGLGVAPTLRRGAGGISLESITLRDCYLRGADLESAHLTNADLRGAFVSNANLKGASLRGAQIQSATCLEVDFRGASFYGSNAQGASFTGCRLENALLYSADLTNADFRNVGGAHNVGWTDAKLDHTWIYRRDIDPIREEVNVKAGRGSFRRTMETYLGLKTNFISVGNYEDASWAYLKEQQMEKAGYFPTTAGRRRVLRVLRRFPKAAPERWWTRTPNAIAYRLRAASLYARLFLGLVPQGTTRAMREGEHGHLDRWRWTRNWLYELTTGYGERPQMPLLWGLVTIVAFAAIYSLAGNVSRTATGPGTHDFLTALTQSMAAFATIGFNDLQPVGWGARLLTAIEAMFGIGIFALFVYTLGNRMSRS